MIINTLRLWLTLTNLQLETFLKEVLVFSTQSQTLIRINSSINLMTTKPIPMAITHSKTNNNNSPYKSTIPMLLEINSIFPRIKAKNSSRILVRIIHLLETLLKRITNTEVEHGAPMILLTIILFMVAIISVNKYSSSSKYRKIT